MRRTAKRLIRRSDPARLKHRVQGSIAESMAWHTAHPEDIERRLTQLDREWDIDRALEAVAAAGSIAGFVLGVTRGRRWLGLPGLLGTFLLQQALERWSPPVPVLRRLGFRTREEIEQERRGLRRIISPYAAHGDADAEPADPIVDEPVVTRAMDTEPRGH
jgi:hypothetical protein